jgi:RNA ligase
MESVAERTFTPFPKIGRLEKDCIITEKLDGTNAAVVVTEDGDVYAQSRTRIITPESDNFGFAAWVAEHADDLRYGLGEGIHFGEWWGKGIQRGYGLDEKRFSLFNTHRWASEYNNFELGGEYKTENEHACLQCPCCYVVPVLGAHAFSTPFIFHVYDDLRVRGSVAARGFDKPEGIVVYHTGTKTLFKVSDAKVQPKEFGG